MRRFLLLPHTERRGALLAAAAAPIVRSKLRRGGYVAAARTLDRRSRRPVGGIAQAQAVARSADAAMLRMPGTFTCLVRSLVIWWLVGGDDTGHIRFGVAPPETGQTPRFHAWVEVDGVPINDAADVATKYLPFTSGSASPDRFD